MTTLLWDRLRRQWPVCVFSCAACGVLLAVFLPFNAISLKLALMPMLYVAGASGVAFAQRGFARTLLTMPITAKQIGRSWWWTAVGIPGLLLAMIIGLVFAYITVFRHHPLSAITFFCRWWLPGAAFLGGWFFCFSGLFTMNRVKTRVWIIRDVLISIFLIESVLSLILALPWAPPQSTKWDICLVLACVLTVAGWFRVEGLVLSTAGVGNVPLSSSGPNAKASRCMEGRGGFPYLLRLTVSGLALSAVAITGVFALTTGIIQFRSPLNLAIWNQIALGLFIPISYYYNDT